MWTLMTTVFDLRLLNYYLNVAIWWITFRFAQGMNAEAFCKIYTTAEWIDYCVLYVTEGPKDWRMLFKEKSLTKREIDV